METFKATVRCGVFAFVFVAAAVTFAGLNPIAKAEVGALAESSVGKPDTSLSSAEHKDSLRAELNISR